MSCSAETPQDGPSAVLYERENILTPVSVLHDTRAYRFPQSQSPPLLPRRITHAAKRGIHCRDEKSEHPAVQ